MLLASPHYLLRSLGVAFFAATLFSTLASAQKILDPGTVGTAYSASAAFSFGENEVTNVVYSSDELPDGLSINSTSGEISGVPTTAGVFIFTVTVSYVLDGNPESSDGDVSISISPQANTPEITNVAPPDGMVGTPYSHTITASESPTSFNIDSDDLPNGLSSDNATGEISGTPTEAGTFPVTVSANNANGTGAELILSITIDPSGDLPEISSSSTISGETTESFFYQIEANNTPTSYTASNLPPGLSLDASSGIISGTPSVEGSWPASLTAVNIHGSSDPFILTITIGDVPEISSVLTLTLVASEAMDPFTITASNNPTAFNINGLPSGLQSTNSVISGTPTESGVTNVSVSAINDLGTGPTVTLVITVVAPVLPTPAPDWRPAEYSVGEDGGSTYLYLHFDQTADDITNFNYFIETSTDEDLDPSNWTSVSLDDQTVVKEVTDNGDSTHSVKVRYPAVYGATLCQYIRYKVEAK